VALEVLLVMVLDGLLYARVLIEQSLVQVTGEFDAGGREVDTLYEIEIELVPLDNLRCTNP
jgi:hypothetical protein